MRTCLGRGLHGLSHIYLLIPSEVQWWVYLLLVLGPDIGMLGYLINEKAGAVSYNIFHISDCYCSICRGILSHILSADSRLILFGHSVWIEYLGMD